MKDLAIAVLFLLALPVIAIMVCLAYAWLVDSVKGAFLSLGALRARRIVGRAGGVEHLSDSDLLFVKERLSARMAIKPLYRRPRWLYWGYDLQEQAECQMLTREAQALISS